MAVYYITREVTYLEEYKIECDFDDNADIVQQLHEEMSNGLDCYSSNAVHADIIEISYEDDDGEWHNLELDRIERVGD
jgi:hypothetical protein